MASITPRMNDREVDASETQSGIDSHESGTTSGAAPKAAAWDQRWQATTMPYRILVVLSAALLVTTALLVRAGIREKPRRVVTVVHTVHSLAATIDAGGCPSSARCRLLAAAAPGTLAALARHFPGARVLMQQETVDAQSGRAYRSSLLATSTAGSSIAVLAACDPGAPATASYQRRNAATHVGLTGNTVEDSETVTTVVSSPQAGCSLSVRLRSTAAETRDQRAAAALATDQAAQLSR